ncbi:GNAT family N-acetyltransferase [Bacillus sp. SCS-153A]|uniref:GNAT family N-acetyltransferase n=1 Tax=Rossellomorea sedimentorum TaxID=3115294 RepID=UPI0039065BA9
MKTIKANMDQLELAAELFNQYRIFYHQKDDFESCKEYLRERITKSESVIFLSVEEGEEGLIPLGFTQLYPIFSSVSLKRHWLLNDLFVTEKARRKGVGEELLHTARKYAEETNAKGLTLETGEDNHNAQRLYERFGFQKHSEFHYTYTVE